MTIDNVLSQIYQFQTNELVPLTQVKTQNDKDALSQNMYVADFTCDEWKKLFPSIDEHHVFYAPILAAGPMVYYDAEHFIWLNLAILNKAYAEQDPKGLEEKINHAIRSEQKSFEEKDFETLLSHLPDAIRMELLFKVPDIIGEGPEFYRLFRIFYPISDCFTSNFPADIGEKLLRSKSAKQRESTKQELCGIKTKNGKVIVYRGVANKSMPAQKALSWTPDINVAYFFATKLGRNPSVVQGLVDADNIIEYFPTGSKDGNEEEIIVLPGSVSIESTTELLDVGSQTMRRMTTDILPLVQQYNQKADKLYLHDIAPFQDCDHSLRHARRVMIYALLIGRAEKCNQKEMHTLATAAVYHDIGRSCDSGDTTHGTASRDIYIHRGGQDSIAAYLMEAHSYNDITGEHLAKEKLQNSERVIKLLRILKDADALDRLRFGHCHTGSDALDVTMLRLDVSRKMIPFAWTAIKEIK